MKTQFVFHEPNVTQSNPHSQIVTPIRRREPRRATAAPRKRRIDYGSENSPRSERLQRLIIALLLEGSMSVAELGSILGVSRQLALYHLKKLAYQRKVDMTLEPAGNGQLRFRNRLPFRHERVQALSFAAA